MHFNCVEKPPQYNWLSFAASKPFTKCWKRSILIVTSLSNLEEIEIKVQKCIHLCNLIEVFNLEHTKQLTQFSKSHIK